MKDQDSIQSNRELWNRWTAPHVQSDFYDVPAFISGKSSLQKPELELLGDVSDKRILHLQCHFGLDSLSLSRMGAKVVGVDFSDQAIEQAKKLAAQCHLDTQFVVADVLELPAELHQKFDLVYTSYGALTWLPDLKRWATGLKQTLVEGGSLVVVEFHPLLSMLSEDGKQLQYGLQSQQVEFEEQGTYAAPEAEVQGTSITWNHGIGGVLQAILQAGFNLDWFDELDYTPWDCFEFTEQVEPGVAKIPHLVGVPLVYRLRANLG